MVLPLCRPLVGTAHLSAGSADVEAQVLVVVSGVVDVGSVESALAAVGLSAVAVRDVEQLVESGVDGCTTAHSLVKFDASQRPGPIVVWCVARGPNQGGLITSADASQTGAPSSEAGVVRSVEDGILTVGTRSQLRHDTAQSFNGRLHLSFMSGSFVSRSS